MDAQRAPHLAADSNLPFEQDAILRASHEVDRTLLQWFLALSIRERLKVATRTARMLGRFRRAGSSEAS